MTTQLDHFIKLWNIITRDINDALKVKAEIEAKDDDLSSFCKLLNAIESKANKPEFNDPKAVLSELHSALKAPLIAIDPDLKAPLVEVLSTPNNTGSEPAVVLPDLPITIGFIHPGIDNSNGLIEYFVDDASYYYKVI